MRHKSDDHLWFSFFPEAAHVLLHSKKSVFVDEVNGGGTDLEGDFMLAGPSPSVRMTLAEMDSRFRGNDGVSASAFARTSVRGNDGACGSGGAWRE